MARSGRTRLSARARFRAFITKHVGVVGADVGQLEAIGALNFLDLDDILVVNEGEPIDPRSIITLPSKTNGPCCRGSNARPTTRSCGNECIGEKVGHHRRSCRPTIVSLDAHHFLRDLLFGTMSAGPEFYWHRPIIVTDVRTPLGGVIGRMQVKPEHPEDDVIDNDLIVLVWGEQKRIITGADLLGRLLREIVMQDARQN